jgi:hypothetical protein
MCRNADLQDDPRTNFAQQIFYFLIQVWKMNFLYMLINTSESLGISLDERSKINI